MGYPMSLLSAFYNTGNCNISGEKDAWDLGAGASFYVDATEEPWKKFYQMYTYITGEVTKCVAGVCGMLL